MPRSIGLALGSGGARGLAHIGVLKTLEKYHIPISHIAGSSIGAIIGGMYALTKDLVEIEAVANSLDLKKIASLVDPNFTGGLLKGEKIKDFLQQYLGKATFKNTQIPFAAVATNYRTGQPIIFKDGSMLSAIRASMSIPLAFTPVKAGDDLLVDGGLSIPVPAAVVRDMGAETVIAVNLDAYYQNISKKLTYYNLAIDSLGILRHHLAATNIVQADITIEPNVRDNLWFNFSSPDKLIAAGEEATEKAIKKLLV